MITSKTATWSIRLDPAEREALERLARESGRTPAGVVRRLLTLAELPEARAILGLSVRDAIPQERIT